MVFEPAGQVLSEQELVLLAAEKQKELALLLALPLLVAFPPLRFAAEPEVTHLHERARGQRFPLSRTVPVLPRRQVAVPAAPQLE